MNIFFTFIPQNLKSKRYLVAGPAFQTVGVELVDVEDVDGALDAEVVQLAAHFEVQQVVLWTEQGGQEATWRKPDEGMCRLFTRGCFFNPGATFSTHHGEVLQHLSVHSALVELVFVLREADVVQPPFWIARRNKVRVGTTGNPEMPACASGTYE